MFLRQIFWNVSLRESVMEALVQSQSEENFCDFVHFSSSFESTSNSQVKKNFRFISLDMDSRNMKQFSTKSLAQVNNNNVVCSCKIKTHFSMLSFKVKIDCIQFTYRKSPVDSSPQLRPHPFATNTRDCIDTSHLSQT